VELYLCFPIRLNVIDRENFALRIYSKLGEYCGSKVKVKVTLVQAQRLCTGRTSHRGSRGIALLFHEHGTRRE
jgi:hypothetical protein